MDKKRNLFSLSEINPIIRLLILSDFLVIGAFGLITPIFALYITDFIEGATVETVGIAMTIYLATRSVGQLPVGIIIDRIKGQRDDILILAVSSFGFVLVAFAYLFIETVPQLFAAQFMYGLFSAAAYPSWSTLFTRAIDPGKEGFEWSAYQTVVDLGTAATAAIGSFVAASFGFEIIFMLMAFFATLGGFAVLWAKRIMFEDVSS